MDRYLDNNIKKCKKEDLDFVITNDGIYIIKQCPNCNEDRYIHFYWRKQRDGFCSVKCKNEYYNLGDYSKGRDPWNKGKKGLQVAWNKGLHIQTNTGRTHFKKGDNLRENHPNWQNGKSFEPYGLEFNKKLKEQIRKRDNHICLECQVREEGLGYKLHIHHIDYNKKNNSIDNLISLCRSCHMKTNWNRSNWNKYYKSISESNHKTALLKEIT